MTLVRAITDQAIDCAYRIGQKKAVYVYEVVVKDSIENCVLQIQHRKKELIDIAFQSSEHLRVVWKEKPKQSSDLLQMLGV